MRFRSVLVGVLLGLGITVAAQITTNDAVYGRLLGSGVGAWLATPSSANLATAVSDETGTGALVFATNPTITGLTLPAGEPIKGGNGNGNKWNTQAYDVDLGAYVNFEEYTSANTPTLVIAPPATGGTVSVKGSFTSSDGSAGTTGNGFKDGLCVTASGGCGGSVSTSNTVVYKTADESVTSNATPQNDDELLFTVGANEKWLVEVYVWVTSTSSTPDYACTLAIPSGTFNGGVITQGTIGAGTPHNYDSGSLNMVSGTAGVSANGPYGAQAIVANETMLKVFIATVSVGVTGGTANFRWSQDVSDGVATTVKAGSFLRATRIS